MSVTIIRPPLVYGANAPGNFGTLLRFINRQIPLPLGAIKNKRSFVYMENLIDFILCCVSKSKAANQIFLVSDNEDLSTTEFLRKISKAYGKKIMLLPVPTFILNIAAKAVGKDKTAQQLFGSLQINIDKNMLLLNWKPPYSVNAALLKMANEK